MTEQDSKIEQESATEQESKVDQEQLSQQEQTAEITTETIEEDKTELENETDSEELSVSDLPNADDATEETSAFFEQWKARHEAYLASQDEPKESDISEEHQEPQITKQPIFKGIKRIKKTPESETEAVETVKKLKLDIPSKVIWKAVPVLTVSLLLAALALYFISPTSKKKQIEVIGNERLTAEQVENYSLISPDDYVMTIALHANAYANNIKKNSSTVESAKIRFQLPDKFTIHIKEYAIIGYIEQQNRLYPVLSSGEISGAPVSQETLPESYTKIQLSDRELVKKLAVELGKIDAGIRARIQTINLTPSKVTADLLTFSMADGNTVLVPLSEISQKMPYYAKIASEVNIPTTIDMEVGIYRYAS
ncbi:FtsQ-type POTRA domain-containing protein [Streptococcus ruminantium]|nr:FtsQ-type POTRA domain-containing protein [Streptococcus ruminantium]MDQ8767583.1 FtsQ-type POTRA domain-containing protein [Streptococcus ruminantium]MDQ8780719.1 FtsQ-type POTRA domain-containing protein [Streptococcus ruminantium]